MGDVGAVRAFEKAAEGRRSGANGVGETASTTREQEALAARLTGFQDQEAWRHFCEGIGDSSELCHFLKHQKVGPRHFVYVEAVDGVLSPVPGALDLPESEGLSGSLLIGKRRKPHSETAHSA